MQTFFGDNFYLSVDFTNKLTTDGYENLFGVSLEIKHPAPKGGVSHVIPGMARNLKIPHFVRDDNKRRKRRGI